MNNNSLLQCEYSISELPSDYKYYGIDVVKFFCAIMVVMIHISPLEFFIGGKESNIFDYANFILQHCLCRLAVPFYFTAAGFLLFRKMELRKPNNQIIRNYCFRLLRLFGTWIFLLFLGGTEHLWFLGALVLAVVLLRLLSALRIRLRYLIIILLLLYIFGLMGTSWYGITESNKALSLIMNCYEAVFLTTRNGVFFAPIYVFMGAVFAHHKIVISFKLAIIGFLISLSGMVVEVFLLWKYSDPKDYSMFLFLLPSTFFLFYFASHANNLPEKSHGTFRKLRVIGTLVFYSHMFVNYCVIRIIELTSDSIKSLLFGLRFWIVISLTLIISTTIEKLSHRKHFSWLRYLYS